MARGQVYSGLITASGTYQPAPGVEVMLLMMSPTGVGDSWGISDGVTEVFICPQNTTRYDGIRVPITNTNYLRYIKTTLALGWSGIQTK